MKTRVSLRHFVIDFLWKNVYALNHFIISLFGNFGNSKDFYTIVT